MEYSVRARLERTTAHFIEKLDAQHAPPLYTLSPEAAREVLNTIQSGPVETAPTARHDFVIPVGSDDTVNVTLIRPIGTQDMLLPVIVYMHGAGWILGGEHTHNRLIRQLAYGAHAAIVFVNYTLSPEAHYPKALNQGYATLAYIAQHGHNLKLDTTKLVIAGDSVGGNMATVIARWASERTGPRITYQLLFYPVTDASMNSCSYTQFAEGPWLTKTAMEWFWNAYEPRKEERKHPDMSPLHASVEQLAHVPPALIITAENDVLRDEGESYAHKLMQAGVEVKALRCLGTIHDFLMLNALAKTPAAQAAMSLTQATLRNVFAL